MRKLYFTSLLISSIILIVFKQNYASDINKETVGFKAKILQSEDFSSYDLYITIEIEEGWFVFSEVSNDLPFQPLQLRANLPNGHQKMGNPQIHSEKLLQLAPGLTAYHGLIVVQQHFEINTLAESQNVDCEVIYQAGDCFNTLPAQVKRISVKF